MQGTVLAGWEQNEKGANIYWTRVIFQMVLNYFI